MQDPQAIYQSREYVTKGHAFVRFHHYPTQQTCQAVPGLRIPLKVTIEFNTLKHQDFFVGLDRAEVQIHAKPMYVLPDPSATKPRTYDVSRSKEFSQAMTAELKSMLESGITNGLPAFKATLETALQTVLSMQSSQQTASSEITTRQTASGRTAVWKFTPEGGAGLLDYPISIEFIAEESPPEPQRNFAMFKASHHASIGRDGLVVYDSQSNEPHQDLSAWNAMIWDALKAHEQEILAKQAHDAYPNATPLNLELTFILQKIPANLSSSTPTDV